MAMPPVLDADPDSPTVGQTIAPRYRYGYDALGRQTAIVDPRGNATRFAYNDLGQQISRTLPIIYP